ncbi:MAG: glycosyltransferase family 4 protein [bacterium]
MRLLLVIYGSIEQQSGGYRYDGRLVEYLRNRGHELNIFSQQSGSYPMRLLRDRPGRLISQVETFRPDIILEDELNHPSLVRTNRAVRRAAGPPIVTIVHHLNSDETHRVPASQFMKMVERRYLRTVDGAIYNTPATQNAVATLLGRPLEGVVCLPSVDGLPGAGADIAREVPRARTYDGGMLRLLTVGSLTRRKRMDAVITAVARAGDPHITLTIAGDDRVEPATARALRRLSVRLGVDRQVSFAGSLDARALDNAYREHDLFVLPSQHEGFGMVYLEAMARAMPVIATSSGGAAAIVRSGVNGYLCAPGAAGEVAARIVSLRKDPARLAELAGGALRTASAHPSWDESFSAGERFLQRLV